MSDPDPVFDLTPRGVIDANGNYVLQHQDIYNLLKYVWTGALIAITPAEYQARVGITPAGYAASGMRQLVEPLLVAYVNVNSNCKVFKNQTYPSIVNLANTIYDFAQNSGGTIENSYYGVIFTNIQALAAETAKPIAQQNRTSIQEFRNTIKALIDAQVQAIDNLRVQAVAVTNNLRSFEQQCLGDQTALNGVQTDVKKRMVQAGTDVATLESQIEGYRQQIREAQAEWEKDVIAATTSLTYAAIPLVGWIAAPIVMGVFTDKAIRMKQLIDELYNLIKSQNVILYANKMLVADMNLVKNDLATTLSLIGPAIIAIEGMMNTWESIAGDLRSVQTYVDSNVRRANAALTETLKTNVLRKWDDLKTAVDKYRQVAFMSTPEMQSIEKYSQDLAAAINK